MSFDSLIDADLKEVRHRVFVAGRRLHAPAWSAAHAVDAPVGRATLVLPLPLPGWVAPNAPVVVQAGYAGLIRTVFAGRIPGDERAVDDSGRWARVRAVGWGSLLAYPDEADLRFEGPIRLDRIFRGLCKRRRVPLYRADRVVAPGGHEVELGGVAEVDDGDVVIRADESPLAWLERVARLFGCRVFDTPAGPFVLRRVAGLPRAGSRQEYAEGHNAYRMSRTTDTDAMVTYWDVAGARYTAADGREVAVRSFPDRVPYAAELDPPGYRKRTLSDAVLVTGRLADAARAVAERNGAAPDVREAWDTDGDPRLAPGDVVRLDAPSLGAAGKRWLMSIDQAVGDQGYTAAMAGWAGAGEELPAGDDCTVVTISTETHHVGNTTVAWYADPSPDGVEVRIAFEAPDQFSSLTIEGQAHGCNSHLETNLGDDPDAESRPSVFEVWQRPDPGAAGSDDNALRRVGSGELPGMEERTASQPPYATDDDLWADVVIPVTGSIVGGPAQLRLVAGTVAGGQGEDRDSTDDDRYDEFEVRGLRLVACGVGRPDLPRAR